MTPATRQRLPLFPLGTVLYPGLLLPLHIFEPRYRQLVHDLVRRPEGEPRQFGVIAIREGREVGADGVRALHDVGCTAVLHQVQPYDDGRFDIVATGATRFRLHQLHDAGTAPGAGGDATAERRPYLQGDVDLLEERAGPEAHVLASSVAEHFAAYRNLLLSARRQAVPLEQPLPADPVVLSYLVAAATVLELGDKQRLLAAPDTVTRLSFELQLLRRENALLRRLSSLPGVELSRQPYSLS